MITGVAIRHRKTGYVLSFPKPARHCKLIQALRLKDNVEFARGEQGFITAKGEFLDREQALQHVKDCGQETMHRLGGEILMSEDVW